MNKSNKIRLKVIGSSLTVFIGVSTFIGYLVYDGSVGSSQKIKNEDVVEVFSSRENKPLERLKNYEYEDVFIDSPENGYKIEAKLIKSNIKTDKTVILVHGIESYYYEYLDKA